MTRLLTPNIATMTELREPQKVLDRANGEPIAILKNSKVAAYLVPADHIGEHESRYATQDEFEAAFEATREQAQPVLDYLKDK
ncbi:MAG: hypothetical protein ACPGRD_10900 [Planktomarina sp.]